MKNIMEFMTWAMHRASAARIPRGSNLCIPMENVGSAGAWKYLYGTTGSRCTQSILDSRYTKYYRGWGYTRAEYDQITAGWVSGGKYVCDCQGLEDCFSKSDTNAKGNYANYCTDKGKMQDIGRNFVIGEALFCGSKPSSINHVGWIAGFAPEGEPLILHERGIYHGCVVERLSQSGKTWTYRGIMSKRYDYGPIIPKPVEDETEAPPEEKGTVLAIEKPLMRGEAIGHLQMGLNGLGYPCGQPDGICGENTMAGVRAFVAAHKGA